MTLYVDTSSLVKLFTAEAGFDVVLDQLDDASIAVTSVVAYAETRAALARLRRTGVLSVSGLTEARRNLDADWMALLALDVTQPVTLEAGELAERYQLRGYDSIHLASFAEVARRAGPETVTFSSFDGALNRAARSVTRGLTRARRRKASAPSR